MKFNSLVDVLCRLRRIDARLTFRSHTSSLDLDQQIYSNSAHPKINRISGTETFNKSLDYDFGEKVMESREIC